MNNRGLKTLEFPKIINLLENKAQTSLGKELTKILKPNNDYDTIYYSLSETKEAMDVIRLKGGLSLGGISDISPYVKRAKIGGILNAEQLIDISNTLYGSRKLKRFLSKVNEDYDLPILFGHAQGICDLKVIEDNINSCINEYGEIIDSASPELKRIRQQIRTLESRIKEKLEEMIRSSRYQKMLQDPIVTIRNNRYVLPVKQEYRSEFGGMIHDQSASGATLFMEPQSAVTINNQLKELYLKEEKEIEKILKSLTNDISIEAESIQLIIEHVGKIDFIQAKAELAKEMKATQPKLNDNRYINIKKGRHPLINYSEVVPIDVRLGGDYNSIVITGPNTGGKTVTLKTIGLLTLMTMSGLYIPSDEGSEIGVFSTVYADIGDEQSIEQSLSTFSGHLKNIIEILDRMDEKSLILFDELGAGTDPTEGAALAVAILEKVNSIGARVVATTHYSELKAYAYNKDNVINASVEFDVETLKPTYRLLIGVPGRSNAFAIAKRLGLSDDIIDLAKGQISEDNLQVESMIESLEMNRKVAEKERIDAERLKFEAEEINKKLEKKVEDYDKQKEQLILSAKEEAEKIIAKAKNEAEEVIAELRKLALEEKTGIKEHKLIEMKKRLDDTIPQLDINNPINKKRKNEKLNIGDEVKILSLDQKGSIVEIASEDEYLVQIGIMKMKINKYDISLIKESKPQKKINITKVQRSSTAKPEIDVRGTTVDEAIIRIDRYLDEAFLEGFGQVSIIHGKGTGALRAGLQDFLRNHSHVKAIRTGQHGEGGLGVTIVELK